MSHKSIQCVVYEMDNMRALLKIGQSSLIAPWWLALVLYPGCTADISVQLLFSHGLIYDNYRAESKAGGQTQAALVTSVGAGC